LAAPQAMLLTNIFSLDASTLGSSIKDFFDQIDQLGLRLSDEQVDLLYSVGMTAAAAVAAFELARRQVRRRTLSQAPRLGAIPYSDYP
jgi:hypothetical protein